MVGIVDVILPIVTLVAFAILTVPVLRLTRRNKHKTALTLLWFSTVFLVSGAAVANIASQYYGMPSPQPFLNVSLTNAP